MSYEPLFVATSLLSEAHYILTVSQKYNHPYFIDEEAEPQRLCLIVFRQHN